jgi:hypothetical protein
MQKLVASLMLVSMLAMVLAPVATLAADTITPVVTGFTASVAGSGNMTPVIKAVWETPDNDLQLTETQINPPGACNQQKAVKICAVMEDDSLLDTMSPTEVNAVLNGKAWLYYDSRPLPATDDYNVRVNLENAPIALVSLTKDEGYALFCGPNGDAFVNPSLIKYYNRPSVTPPAPYTYADICSSYGQLQKGTARVFCGEYLLSYEAAAGNYEVQVKATDGAGANVYTPEDSNWFTYVALTDYEVDFSTLNYGNVAKGEWDLDMDGNNIGDELWNDLPASGSDRPSVRNIGNTELRMQVAQSNMVNSNNGQILVPSYKARVGSNVASWINYGPSTTLTTLQEKLNLSTILEMDFGILTNDFIQAGEAFSGTMTLDATYVPFETGLPTSIHSAWTCPGV